MKSAPPQVAAETTDFLTLLVQLSARFVSVRAERVDGEIEDAQRQVCERLGFDVSSLWLRVGGREADFLLTHFHRSMPGPLPAEPMLARGYFPWCVRELLAGRVIALPSLGDLPPEAARDAESHRYFGVESILDLPLSLGGGPVIGVLTFATMREERAWPEPLVERLQLIAQVFANALARTRADEALAESERRFRATFEQAAVGIAHVALDGRFLRFNRRFCDIVGYAPEEMAQRTLQDVARPEGVAGDTRQTDRLLRGEIETFTAEKLYVHRSGGPVWGSVTDSLVRNEAGEPEWFVRVVEDITERKRAEEELNRLRSQLWHADRAAQVGVITASLAHELNQPLAAILTNAQAGLRFMAGGDPDLEEIRGILADIVHDDKRAGAVVSGLRSLLRRRETLRESVGLADAMQEVLEFLRSELLDRRVQTSLRRERDTRVSADRTQLQQVILNLVMNAIDAMKDRPADQRRLELTLTRTDAGEALVMVRDSGTGVPEDQRAKLFEPFWTTKDQGMGIGLAISRSIVESHGGRLWFENNPDRGATFYLALPTGDGAESSS